MKKTRGIVEVRAFASSDGRPFTVAAIRAMIRAPELGHRPRPPSAAGGISPRLAVWCFSPATVSEITSIGRPRSFCGRTFTSDLSATTGAFKTRVASIGPQIGYLFPVAHMHGYINLKGYQEFASENRPSGWIAWLTLSIAPKTPEAVVLGR